MARINDIEITGREVLHILCDGNPGALNVMMLMLENHEHVDPDSMMTGALCLLSLDTYEIYGPHIWMLYKDCCNKNIVGMFAALRTVQLGIRPVEWLKRHIIGGEHGNGIPIDCDAVIKEVQERLPNFGKQQGESK